MPNIYRLNQLMLRGNLALYTNDYPPPLPVAQFSVNQLGGAQQAADTAAGHNLGRSIALSGNTLVVGASNANLTFGSTTYTNAGALYVFEYQGGNWVEVAKLTAGDPLAGGFAKSSAQLGVSVDVDGDYIVAGAYVEDNLRGAAYVFEKTPGGWTSTPMTRLAPTPGTDDNFGLSVAVSGDTAAVGAWGDDVGGTNSGAVYIYVRSGSAWTLQTKLKSPLPSSSAGFGRAVDLSANVLVAGAYQEGPGAAYVFDRAGGVWSSGTRFQPDQPIANSRFGSAIALSGNTILVGAPNVSGGYAYAFQRSGGGLVQKAILTARPSESLIIDPSVSSIDSQGISVALDGDIAVIGASRNLNRGAIYVYERVYGSWVSSLTGKAVATNGASGDLFGIAVSISAGQIAVGANRRDTGANLDTGAFYIFG